MKFFTSISSKKVLNFNTLSKYWYFYSFVNHLIQLSYYFKHKVQNKLKIWKKKNDNNKWKKVKVAQKPTFHPAINHLAHIRTVVDSSTHVNECQQWKRLIRSKSLKLPSSEQSTRLNKATMRAPRESAQKQAKN